MFGTQRLKNGPTVVLRSGPEPRDGRLVAAFLTLDTNPFVGPPDKRVEPEHRLPQNLERIDGGVKTQDMAQLVSEDVTTLLVVNDVTEGRWQVDVTAQQTPNERLADTVQRPHLRRSFDCEPREHVMDTALEFGAEFVTLCPEPPLGAPGLSQSHRSERCTPAQPDDGQALAQRKVRHEARCLRPLTCPRILRLGDGRRGELSIHRRWYHVRPGRLARVRRPRLALGQNRQGNGKDRRHEALGQHEQPEQVAQVRATAAQDPGGQRDDQDQ